MFGKNRPDRAEVARLRDRRAAGGGQIAELMRGGAGLVDGERAWGAEVRIEGIVDDFFQHAGKFQQTGRERRDFSRVLGRGKGSGFQAIGQKLLKSGILPGHRLLAI